MYIYIYIYICGALIFRVLRDLGARLLVLTLLSRGVSIGWHYTHFPSQDFPSQHFFQGLGCPETFF